MTDTESTLNIRHIPTATKREVKSQAAALGLSLAQWLTLAAAAVKEQMQ